jgi:hypothetical protein
LADLRKITASRTFRIALIAVSVSAALLVINFVSLPFAPCIQPEIVGQSNNAKKNADEKNACPEARGVVSAGLYVISNWTAEAWTAAATIILALCTFVLASATSRQVQLARQEFIATNRPRLRVRRFELHQIPNDDRMNVSFSIVNVGNSEAILNESGGNIDIVPPSVIPMPIYEGLTQVIDPKVFAPGTRDCGSILARPMRGQGAIIRVYGFLSYADGLGNIRTTAFCRKWNNGSQRFQAMNDPDCEYED